MANEKIRVDLESRGDTSGFEAFARAHDQMAAGFEDDADGLLAYARAADGVTKPIAAAAKSSKDFAGELGRSVESGSATVGLFQNIATASQGGAAGLAAAARAGLGFGQVMKGMLAGAGPIGITLAGVGVAAGALMTIFSDSGKAAEEAKQKMGELDKLKLAGVTAEQKALADEASRAVAAIQAELAAMDRIADRRTARLIEEERAKNLPKELEERNITRIRRQAEDEKLGRQQSALDRELEVALGAEEASRSANEKAQIERDMFASLKARRDAARVEFADAFNAQRSAMEVGAPAAEVDAATSRKSDARLALAAAERAYESKVGGKDGDGSLFAERLKTLEEALKQTTDAYKAAQKSTDEARQKADQERSTQAGLKPETAALRTAEDKNARGESPEEKAKREREIERLKGLGRSVVDNRMAGGAAVDEAAYIGAFGQKAWDRRPTPRAEMPGTGGTIQRGGEVFRGGAGGVEKIAESLDGAAEAMSSAPAGEGAAASADAVKKATEDFSQKRAAADEAQRAALTQAASAITATGEATIAIAAAAAQDRARIARVESQVRGLISRMYA